MKGNRWTKTFEAHCRHWHVALGLTDWTIRFALKAKPDDGQEAEILYNVDNRHAVLQAFVQAPDRLPPERVALHEMLHLLFADYCSIAAKRGNDNHPDCMREEHRIIERLLNVIDTRAP